MTQGKAIVLCSDGTWNRGGPGAPTNVWRLHQALDRQGQNIVTCHDNGVGTERGPIGKLMGGAFGFGLYTNVADLYAFLIRQYRPGDRIYLFGFSRGAFTVRLLSGILDSFGIVDPKQFSQEPTGQMAFEESPERAAEFVVRAFRRVRTKKKVRSERLTEKGPRSVRDPTPRKCFHHGVPGAVLPSNPQEQPMDPVPWCLGHCAGHRRSF